MDTRTKALWHRHWIDGWGGLLVATITTMILCAVFAANISVDATDEGIRPTASPETSAPLAVQSDAHELAAWSAHAFTTVLASLVLTLFIHGTGIRSNDLTGGHPSIYFNLTLPVSRTRLVLTRFLMSALCALALIGALFFLNAAVLLVFDYPVPAKEMAQTSLVGSLFLITAAWILDLTALVGESLSGWLIPLAALGVAAAGWSNVMSLIAGHPITSTRILVLSVLAALALASAIVVAHKRDF